MATFSSHPQTRALALALLVLLTAGTSCGPARTAETPAPAATLSKAPSRSDAHILAGKYLTGLYAQSRLAPWKIEARAAGPQCDVLLLHVAVIMEDSMIEAMHFGTGPYDAVAGGLQRFYHLQDFRGVAYQDKSSRIWTYGNVTENEAATLVPCH